MSIYTTIGLKHCTGSVYNQELTNKEINPLTQTNKQPKTPVSGKSNFKQQNKSTTQSYTLNHIHNSRHPNNFETLIHRTDYFMKKYHQKQESQQKDWKPSIRTYPTEVSQQSVSPSVSQRKQFYQPIRNPILLSPSPKKPKKQSKKTCLEKVLKKETKEGIRVFKQANSSDGFIASLDFSTPHNKPITIISPRYGEGVQMRHIFSQ